MQLCWRSWHICGAEEALHIFVGMEEKAGRGKTVASFQVRWNLCTRKARVNIRKRDTMAWEGMETEWLVLRVCKPPPERLEAQ